MVYDKYNKYNKKNKKSNKKKTNKKTSSNKKSNFSKKQYKIIKSIASKVSQNNNNVEWKQLVCDYSNSSTRIVNGNNSSITDRDNPINYNFKFRPMTQLALSSSTQPINFSSGIFTANNSNDTDDDTTQNIQGRRINIKSIYVKGYIKYKIDSNMKTPQSAGFIIYKQKYNKDADKVINTADYTNYETIPDIQDMYKEPITTTTTAGVLNMRYNALTNPLKKREFIPLMRFTKTVNKYDTDMTEYNFKVSKFYKFKYGLPVKWCDDVLAGVDSNYKLKLSEINNLYFVPWFSYIPETDNPNWEMRLKIYINYTDI